MQKIAAQLTFDSQAEAAVNFYVSIFNDAKILKITRFSEKEIAALDYVPEDVRPGPPGAINMIKFQLAGQEFLAVNGGSFFKFSPAVSFFVTCATTTEMELLFTRLADGGTVLMPREQSPLGTEFGWVQDKFGVSWQLSLTNQPQSITPFLMFVGEQHGKAAEAMRFYTSLFQDATIQQITHNHEGDMQPAGTVMHATFLLGGQKFMAMDSALAHLFSFTEGISFYVKCATQAEIDFLWDKLAEGGQTQDCGWLTDRYGVAWQISAAKIDAMLDDPDPVKAERVRIAIYGTTKLNIEALQAAYQQAV